MIDDTGSYTSTQQYFLSVVFCCFDFFFFVSSFWWHLSGVLDRYMAGICNDTWER